jgi:hypothetical protein
LVAFLISSLLLAKRAFMRLLSPQRSTLNAQQTAAKALEKKKWPTTLFELRGGEEEHSEGGVPVLACKFPCSYIQTSA